MQLLCILARIDCHRTQACPYSGVMKGSLSIVMDQTEFSSVLRSCCCVGKLGGPAVPVQQQSSAARWRRPVPACLSEHTRNKQAQNHGRQGQGNGDETSLEHVPQIDTEAVSAQKLHFYDVCVLIAPTLSPPEPQMSCMRPS